MLDPSAFSRMRVMFATPCYDMQTTSPYTVSAFSLAGDALKVGLDNRLELYSESLIPRARNRLQAMFLKDKSFTHLFLIDADLLYATQAVFRLLLADKDIAVQVYPLKQFNWPPVMQPGITQQQFEERYGSYPFFPINNETDEDGFAEVYPATTGFMCIKRHVIEKMMEAYPERQYVPDDKTTMDGCHWDFFQSFIHPVSRRYWSEDYGFTHLWHELGGKTWADVDSRLMHLGRHLFRGDLSAKLGVARQ